MGHPEDVCRECGRANPVWYVSNALWNKVMDDSTVIICPVCFILSAEKRGIQPTAWRLSREGDESEVNELRVRVAELSDKLNQFEESNTVKQ